jgi:hypothetical protein
MQSVNYTQPPLDIIGCKQRNTTPKTQYKIQSSVSYAEDVDVFQSIVYHVSAVLKIH